MTAGAMLALLPAFIVVELPGEENALLYQESYSTDEVVEDDATVAQFRRRFEEAWELALGEATWLPAHRRSPNRASVRTRPITSRGLIASGAWSGMTRDRSRCASLTT